MSAATIATSLVAASAVFGLSLVRITQARTSSGAPCVRTATARRTKPWGSAGSGGSMRNDAAPTSTDDISRLRALLRDEDRARGITRSELEERFLAFVHASGFPRPRLNAPIVFGGRFFELDAAWVDRRVAVELDGRAAHGTRLAFERDRERDRLLVAAGWRVVRVTWRQLREDRPALAADLRRILAA